jgi:SAM-dependent methyltransferase
MNGSLAQERLQAFRKRRPWDSEPSDRQRLSRDYFLDIERHRYDLQPHILDILKKIDWHGKRVLEVGAGIGTDGRNIIARGGIYTGIDVDRGSTEATAQALRAFALPGVALKRDATALDFADGSFDVVYSFGALPHIPEVARAVAEIHRVLKPGGAVLATVYNRSSIHDARVSGAQRPGRNANGPDYPCCRVYDEQEAEALFAAFRIESNEVHFFDHRRWGVLGHLVPKRARAALGRRWGWHRVVHATKAGP